MQASSPLAVVPMMIIVLVIMWLASKRNARVILQRQFRAAADPGGPYTECDVRFPLDDLPAPCVVRTTPQGWYMVTPDAMRKKPNWANNVAFLKRPVFIPWDSLDYYRAKFPMSDWTRFDVKGTKATFFVRGNVTRTLLQASGMPPPRETR